MRRLVCAFVVRKPPKTGFLASRPILYLSGILQEWSFYMKFIKQAKTEIGHGTYMNGKCQGLSIKRQFFVGTYLKDLT